MPWPYPDNHSWGSDSAPADQRPATSPHAQFKPSNVVDCRGASAPAGLRLDGVARVEVRRLDGYKGLCAIRLCGLDGHSVDFIIDASDLQRFGDFLAVQGKDLAAAAPRSPAKGLSR